MDWMNIIISKSEPGIVASRREIVRAMTELRKRPNWKKENQKVKKDQHKDF
jgi:hypothetical protein